MALTYVGGNTGSWAGATSGNNTVSLTALTGGSGSAAQAGDIVIAVYATGSTADRTLSISDGTNAYTLIGSELYANGTSYDTNLRVAYKVLTAADTSVTFGPTGNNADGGAAAVHVWRGVNATTPLDVTATTATGTGTGRPTPPSITPTTSGAFILCAGGAAAATGATFTATQLSNFRTDTGADTNDGMVGLGSFAWTSGAFTPTQWTGGTTNAADSWAAISLALRPAATQTLTPSLFTNTNSFFSPTVTQLAPSQTLSPALFTNTNTFYSATVTRVANASCLISGIGDVTVSAVRIQSSAVAIAGLGTLTISGSISFSGAANIDAVSVFTINGARAISGAVDISALSSFSVSGNRLLLASAEISATSTVAATGLAFINGQATVYASSVISVTGALAWERVPVTPETWNAQADVSVSWTAANDTSETWTPQANVSQIWTEVEDTAQPWTST